MIANHSSLLNKMKNFVIFQLRRDCPSYRAKAFASLDLLNACGLSVDITDYTSVYSGSVSENKPCFEGCETNINAAICEWLFQRFNCGSYPEDYAGHSLSTGDIIMIDNKYYYCDSYSFEEINVD